MNLDYFTRNPRYLQMGQTFFDSIVKYTRNDVAYAVLSDVKKKTQRDDTESFFFADTEVPVRSPGITKHDQPQTTVLKTEAHSSAPHVVVVKRAANHLRQVDPAFCKPERNSLCSE